MNKIAMKIRLMKVEDFSAVVRIDEKVTKASRADYYHLKFETAVQSADHVPTSLVAEDKDGKLVGFVIGDLYIGEYGITQRAATLETIGIDPDYQHQGIGEQLINEFMNHLRALGVKKVSTLVDEDNVKMTHFFKANSFGPSKTINMERGF
ncbi:MAG: GNAT family N-acetyltransferase [Proteobacteria bacterium]|nr:GNAT family N-acetyltransferase [Pseudomonadota bacterium]